MRRKISKTYWDTLRPFEQEYVHEQVNKEVDIPTIKMIIADARKQHPDFIKIKGSRIELPNGETRIWSGRDTRKFNRFKDGLIVFESNKDNQQTKKQEDMPEMIREPREAEEKEPFKLTFIDKEELEKSEANKITIDFLRGTSWEDYDAMAMLDDDQHLLSYLQDTLDKKELVFFKINDSIYAADSTDIMEDIKIAPSDGKYAVYRLTLAASERFDSYFGTTMALSEARKDLAMAKTREDVAKINASLSHAFDPEKDMGAWKEYNGLMKEATERVRQSEIDERKDNPFAGSFGGAREERQPEHEPSFTDEGSQEDTGKLYEFFTPQSVADTMAKLAVKHGFKGGSVLEPAAGNGRLIKHFAGCDITAFEINKNNYEQLTRNFPYAEIYNDSFEVAFLKPPRLTDTLSKDASKTWLKKAPFDLVISNPPYGVFTGFYKSYFSVSERFESFFMIQSLKLLKKGRIAVYLIPSSFMRNGVKYNDVKKDIFGMATLVDSYRLPINIFKDTQIGTDIVVLKKK